MAGEKEKQAVGPQGTRLGYRQSPFSSPCRPLRQPRHPSCCVRPKDPPKRPDPATYSQREELAAGREPSWNSPDITTNHWSPWRLFTEPEAKVRNLSADVSAVNVSVQFEISVFGIGMPRTTIGTHLTNLAPSQERTLVYPLPQSVLDGEPRVATFATIHHATDAVVINNKGAQAVNGVFTSEAGRSHQLRFPVRNATAANRTITLSVTANDVGAVVAPGNRVFAPFEQIEATLSINVPGTLHGAPGAELRRELTVIAWDAGGGLIGGITHIVKIDD